MQPIRTYWGQRIATARRAAGLTQVQLAAALQIPQQNISNWEIGRCAPDIERRVAIARILNIPGGATELFAYPDVEVA